MVFFALICDHAFGVADLVTEKVPSGVYGRVKNAVPEVVGSCPTPATNSDISKRRVRSPYKHKYSRYASGALHSGGFFVLCQEVTGSGKMMMESCNRDLISDLT